MKKARLINQSYKRIFVIVLLLLLSNISLAGELAGTYHFNIDDMPIWDISGNYQSITMLGVKQSEVTMTSLPLYVNSKGIITGNGTGYGGIASLEFKSKGKLTRSKGENIVILSVKCSGGCKGTLTYKGVVKSNGVISGTMRGKVCGDSIKIANYEIPLLSDIGDGHWGINFSDITTTGGKKITGSAVIKLSNGRSDNFTVTGKYNAKKDTAQLRVFSSKTQGSQIYGSLSITINCSDHSITQIKGKLLGLNLSSPKGVVYINHPPVLGAIGDKSVAEGSALSFSVSATDADGDTITYSAQSIPSGASFAGQSFSWEPNYEQAGTYLVTFIASDGQAQDSETITITVDNISRVIEFPRANPDTILIGEPATVTVTVQIGADPELLMNEVYLLRLDDAGFVQENLGLMYDNGTHGDALIGDGTFTTQVQLNEPSEGQVRLKAQANYITSPSPAYSDVVIVSIVKAITPDEFVAVLQTLDNAKQLLEQLKEQFPANEAREETIQWALNQPNVSDALLSTDGTTIILNYTCEIEGDIPDNPQGTWGATDKVPQSNHAIVLAPFDSVHDQPAVYIADKLNNFSCISLSGGGPIKNQAVTVESFKSLYQYGVVALTTHGWVANGNQCVLGTSQEATQNSQNTYANDLQTKRLILYPSGGKEFFAITPKFIKHYNGTFPKSIAYLTSCFSYANDSMATAFTSKGAAAYFGWTKELSFGHGDTAGMQMFDALVDNDKTLGEALSATTRTDPSTGAYLQKTPSNDDFKIASRELITNGNFETGDLSGWTTGFTVGGDFPEYGGPGGYWTAISERKVEGTYSARLGRFDQTYTQGPLGPPQPGDEPSGQDWIYQDVNIPAGSNKTLTFWYKIRTYDTTIWDWFDAKIIDPLTGTTLDYVVSGAGKPGSNYGEYWENDWQEATYDLSPYAGQIIRIQFECREDGYGDQTAVYIDKVSIPCD